MSVNVFSSSYSFNYGFLTMNSLYSSSPQSKFWSPSSLTHNISAQSDSLCEWLECELVIGGSSRDLLGEEGPASCS